MNDYPRVLIIGQGFSKSGGGITLANLFQGWPADNIAVAATEFDTAEDSTYNRRYLLGHLEGAHPWPFSILQRTIYSGPLAQAREHSHDSRLDSLTESTSRSFIKERYLFLQHRCGIYHHVHRLSLSDRFVEWVREFKLDMIYTQLASLGYIRLVSSLQKLMNVPVVIHIMDDWPATIVKPGLFSSYWRRVIDLEFRDLINHSAALMSICQAMSDEYKSRYGREFHPFHNPIDLSMWEGESRTDWNVGSPIRVLYAGRLDNVNMASLTDLCNAISDLRSEGHEIVFEIRTSEVFRENAAIFQNYSGVEIHPYIPHKEMPSKLRSVDLLIIPLDFDKRNLKFTRFSMPGKTSDYMASGTPVLIYAPPENAIVKYARDSGWGYVVDERSRDSLKRAIKRLITDLKMRETLGRKAIELAFRNHDANIVRRDFQQLIRASVDQNRSRSACAPITP